MHPQTEYLINQTYEEQRSVKWFEQRNSMVTASEAGAALGVNKYESKRSYILTKAGIKTKTFGNKFTQFGIDNEDKVREWYEQTYNQKVHEVGVVPHPVHKFIGASPDGVCESGRLVEIKCPSGKTRIKNEVGKMVPLYYGAQMQLQLECCDMEECDFVEYVDPQFSMDGEPHYYVTVIKRDREWFATSLPQLKEVFDIVQQIREDPKKVSLLYKNEVDLREPVKCGITCDESDLEFL